MTHPAQHQSVAYDMDAVLTGMDWMNPPPSSARDGDVFRVHTGAKTDFWRKAFYGYTADNGHFLHKTIAGSFTLEARITGQYHEEYDQAGLMVRLNEEVWLKCGTEYFDNRRHASVVLTREASDWSTLPDFSQDGPVWWRIVREKDSLQVFASPDGTTFEQMRLGYFPPADVLEIGIMCCSPRGSGFDAVFDRIHLTVPAP